jgi:hypothetical protein
MVTTFFFPSEPRSNLIAEPTFVIEKAVTPRGDIFVEYVGDYPARAGPSQLFNSGGTYRLTPSQQSTSILPSVSTAMLRTTFPA